MRRRRRLLQWWCSRCPHVCELGLQRLRDVFDFEPVVYPTARQGNEFLSDSPRARVADVHADVHADVRDPEIRGVVAIIGGNDQLRLLRHLDADVLRDTPTRFYGRSDNTSLGLFLWNAGVVAGRPPTRSFLTEPPREVRESYREQLYEEIVEQVGRYNPGAPVVLGLDWGHTTPIAPLPLGGRVELDPDGEDIYCR